jgi:hypothetical protein
VKERKDIRPKATSKPFACPNHGPVEKIPTLACVACNTFKWNGVDMCGKVIRASTLEWIAKLRRFDFAAHACTRKLGHEGSCKWSKLYSSYEPQ